MSSPISLEDKIQKLKEQLNAVILAHYYQDSDIQDIADFIGDSLDLSRKAAETNADIIIFAGVRFMAEVAKILNPTKKVLIPDVNAGCSLEESCNYIDFKKFREYHKDAVAVTYINCSTEVKALSDIIVTSSNAEKIIGQIPKDKKIIFAPDKFLGGYLMKKTGRQMILWNGTCMVHERFSERELVKLQTQYPKSFIIAHPECEDILLNYADHVGSTSSLLNFVLDNQGAEFIVLTEPGIIHQMEKINPKAKFYGVPGINGGACISCNNCPYMKLNTMEKIYDAMINLSPEIILPQETRLLAEKPLRKMLEMS